MPLDINRESWNCLGWKRFEHLCYSLLLEEVSRHIKDFYISGKDKGRDALFNGVYSRLSGKWIFQFKFHELLETDSKLSGRLFSELKGNSRAEGELDKVSKHSPNHYVVMTTVNITSTYRDKIKELEKKYKFKIHIWTRNKIEKLLEIHEIIYLSYFQLERQSPFRLWNDAFILELDKDESGLFNHCYDYIERHEFFHQINEFLSSTQKCLIVSGISGAGKSRGFMEYAKICPDEYIVLFCNPDASQASFTSEMLKANRKFILILDDAHRFNNINQYLSLNKVPQIYKNLKFVFLTRPGFEKQLKGNALPYIISPSHITEVKIGNLKREDVSHYIANKCPTIDESVRAHIVSSTQSIPLFVVLFAELVNGGKIAPNEIVSNPDIRLKLIETIIQDLRSKISDEAPDLRGFVEQFLITIALIGPVNFSAGTIFDKLVSVIGCTNNQLKMLVEICSKHEIIIDVFGKKKVYPDIVSNQLITDGIKNSPEIYNPSFIYNLLIKFGDYCQNNIIQSLAEVENAIDKDVLSEILDTIDQKLITQNSFEKVFTLKELLKTGISFYKPDWILRLSNTLIHDGNNITRKDKYSFLEYTFRDVIKVIFEHLEHASKNINRLEDVIEMLFNIYKKCNTFELDIKDEIINTIKSIASFERNKPYVFNLTTSKVLLSLFENGDSNIKGVIIDSIQPLFAKQIFVSSVSEQSVFAFNMGIANIDQRNTRELRENAFKIIEKCIIDGDDRIKYKAISILFDISDPPHMTLGMPIPENIAKQWIPLQRNVIKYIIDINIQELNIPLTQT